MRPVYGIDLAHRTAGPVMDDIYPAADNLESRIVEGWSALELGDLETARAALRDVYDVNPTHPALPVLAAGIRRVRPKRTRWRGAVLLAAAVVVGVLAATQWMSRREAPPAQLAAAPATTLPAAPDTPSVSSSSSNPTGTAGHAEVPASRAPTPQTAPTPLDDEALIRQSITRFEGAYRSRWAPLTFRGCEITHEADSATAECRDRPSPAEGDGERTWTFSLRKSGTGWRIISVQPSSPPL